MIICLFCRQKWNPLKLGKQIVEPSLLMLELHYRHVCPGVEYRNKKGVIK